MWYKYPDASDLPYELWANFRTPDGQWGGPQQIDESENQLLDPSLILDSQGRVVAAWEVYNCWIMASTMLLQSQVWSEPLQLPSEFVREHPQARFLQEGTQVVMFSRSSAASVSPVNWIRYQYVERSSRDAAFGPDVLTLRSPAVRRHQCLRRGSGGTADPRAALGTCEGY